MQFISICHSIYFSNFFYLLLLNIVNVDDEFLLETVCKVHMGQCRPPMGLVIKLQLDILARFQSKMLPGLYSIPSSWGTFHSVREIQN